MEAQPETFTVTYVEAAGKPSLPVTGAIGATTPDGLSVVVHLYVEHATIPSVVTHAVRAGGRVNLTVGEVVKRSDITREIIASLVLSPDAARSHGTFLVSQADNAATVRKSRPSPPPKRASKGRNAR
jgi:hypothetical protein